jgi:hypothetical protein
LLAFLLVHLLAEIDAEISHVSVHCDAKNYSISPVHSRSIRQWIFSRVHPVHFVWKRLTGMAHQQIKAAPLKNGNAFNSVVDEIQVALG